MCSKKVKKKDDEVGGLRVGTIPKLTHTTLPLSLQAYLWLTIFRGSPVLRTRPDKEKERRDEGVDRPSGG